MDANFSKIKIPTFKVVTRETLKDFFLSFNINLSDIKHERDLILNLEKMFTKTNHLSYFEEHATSDPAKNFIDFQMKKILTSYPFNETLAADEALLVAISLTTYYMSFAKYLNVLHETTS